MRLFYPLLLLIPLAALANEKDPLLTGKAHYAAGRYDEAAIKFRQTASKEAVYWLGLALLAQGKTDSAGIALNLVTEDDPALYISAQTGLSIVATGRKELKQAEACLRKALDYGDNTMRSTAYLLMARNRKEAGDAAASGAFYRKLLSEFPRSLEAEQARKEFDTPPLKSAKNEVPTGYIIQFGAFSLKANAERLRDKLKPDHPGVTLSEIKKGEGVLYAVWMGTFENEQNARFFAQESLKLPRDSYQVRKKGEQGF